MKRIIIRFGLYGGLVEVTFFFISLLIAGVTKANYEVLRINCYPAILVSVSFTYFGIRYYRDHRNNGAITFQKALGLGMLIVLIPAVCFAFSDTIYDTVLDPGFYNRMEAGKILGLNKTVSGSDLNSQISAIQGQISFYKKPEVNFLVMFITVSFFGFVATVLSAFALRSKKSPKSLS